MNIYRMARELKPFGLALCLVAGVATVAAAQLSYTVSPTSVTFTKTAVGIISNAKSITVTNTGTVSLTISSFSISLPEFQLADGWAPITLSPGGKETYQIRFAPDAPQTFKGQLSITIAGVTNSVVVPLAGTGSATTAAAQVTPTTLTFGPQPLGTTSAPQTVTVRNVGTSNLMVTAASLLPPFSVSGFTGSTTLTPGQSLRVQVSFFGTQAGSYNSTLVFSHDVVNSSGAAVSGTAVAPAALAVTTFPVLPVATQSNAYYALLSSAGGTGNLTWNLNSGSKLPTGLTLSSSGVINGLSLIHI